MSIINASKTIQHISEWIKKYAFKDCKFLLQL